MTTVTGLKMHLRLTLHDLTFKQAMVVQGAALARRSTRGLAPAISISVDGHPVGPAPQPSFASLPASATGLDGILLARRIRLRWKDAETPP